MRANYNEFQIQARPQMYAIPLFYLKVQYKS